jgi:3-hydroxyisobutyrate dehydrogenase
MTTRTSPLVCGFVGIGNIGAGMTASLLRAGFRTVVFDVDEGAVARAVSQGAERAADVGGLTGVADVVFVCVHNEDQLEQVCFGDAGIVATAVEGSTIIVNSTVSPGLVRLVARVAGERGVHVVDAPLSGRAEGAESGDLTLMLGAPESVIEAVRPVLEAVASRLTRVGDVGAGQVAKLANNMMALCNELIVMEAIEFAERSGLARDDLLGVVSASSGASWAASHYSHFDRYRERDVQRDVDMSVRLGKDLRIARAEADRLGLELPILRECSQRLPSMFSRRWDQFASIADTSNTSTPA